MDISSWSLDNKKLIYFVVGVLMLGGVWALSTMPKLEDPELKVKMAAVVTVYPGASAHTVEMEVTDPLEKAIRNAREIGDIESTSINDISIIYVNLNTAAPEENLEQYWDILRRKVDAAGALLPSGVREPVVIDDYGDVFGLFYAVTNDGYTQTQFNDYVDLAKREIENIDGVERVAIYGQRKECIDIMLDEQRMSHLGVLPSEVLMTLNGQNETVYAGYFESGDQRLKVNITGRYQNIDDIRNLIIQGHEDDQIRLGNIASIAHGYEQPVRQAMSFDGKEAMGFSIAAKSGTDIIKIGKRVEAKLSELQGGRVPEGINFNKVFFQADRVKDSLGTFGINLLESILIVVGILMLTMGLRSGYIMGVCLLVIVLGSVLILWLCQGAVQRVSVATFVLAMGMLVDNAIVVIDGILMDLKRGVPRKQALTDIGRKTAMPLLGATMIAILAFYPIYLSPDSSGIYVRDLFIVLAVSLLLSWFVALTYVPVVADRLLKVEKTSNGQEELYGGRWYDMLRSVLTWTISHRWTTIGVAVVLLALSGYGYKFLPQGFFPDMGYDQLYIEYKMPEGTRSDRVTRDLAEIEEYLLGQDNVTHVTTSIGGTPSRYNLVRSIAESSMSYGELIVDFTSKEELIASMPKLQEYLSENYPAAYARAKRYNLMYKKFQIEAKFDGPDPAVLRELTLQAENIMRSSDKVKLVRNSWEQQVPTIDVAYSQPVARDLGLTRSDVGISLLAATDGIPVGVFREGVTSQNIYLRSSTSDGEKIKDLSNSPLFSMMIPVSSVTRDDVEGIIAGTTSKAELLEKVLGTVPLTQVADSISIGWEEPYVARYNGQRSMRAQCDAATGVSVETARRSIAGQIESIELPEGYTMEWQGEYYASSQSTRYLFANYPLAILMMIAILIMLFKDYKKPLIIICAMPLLLIGVVLGFLVSGKTFGFVAIVGTLGLIGMMIKNGVVLMDEINLLLASGVEPVKALLDSTSSRFRPVMMASMTTILGVMPLLSDDLFGALAVTIMGGLFVGTIITLLFIPTLYALFFKIKIEK
ncbi:MAG: efflux RND transporter permease subunit [Rikenellaceae bacterium]